MFTVLKPMNIVSAHTQNSSLLPEPTLHIPVSGRNGCKSETTNDFTSTVS